MPGKGRLARISACMFGNRGRLEKRRERGLRARRPVQQFAAVPLRLFGNAHHFLLELLELQVHVAALLGGVAAVGGLHGQFAHALQHVHHLLGRTLSGLDQVDAIVGIFDGLVGAANQRAHARGNGHARRVVSCGVDALARGQLFHGHALLAIDHGQSGMSELRTDVGIDGVHG